MTDAKMKVFDIAACKCTMIFSCICGNKPIDKNRQCHCQVSSKMQLWESKKSLHWIQVYAWLWIISMLFIGNLDKKNGI